MEKKEKLPARVVSTEPILGGPPFDGGFFATVFHERVRALCAKRGDDTAVVLLHLGDGSVLDLCHIEALTPRWMAVAIYQEGASCEKMDTVFVPYEAIARIMLSKRAASDKRMGFQLEKSAPALTASGAPPP